MSNGHRWSKFWWQDWQGDKCLRRCSMAARGLWMEMLCIAHDGEPYGHVALNGHALGASDLADMISKTTVKEVAKLLAELEAVGVFSRTESGTIYCRRMVKDSDRSEEGRQHIAKRWTPDSTPPPNRGANRSPDREPNSRPNGVASREAIRDPITLEADSESEAEDRKEKKVLNFSSQGEFVSPREAKSAPIAAETEPAAINVEAAEAAAAVITALGKTMRRTAFAPCPFPGKHSILKPDELAEVLVPRRPKPAYLTPEQLRATRKAAGIPA